MVVKGNMAIDIKLTEERGALLLALKASRGEYPASQWWRLRSTTWKPLEAHGLLRSRLDQHGELFLKITAAGRRALAAEGS
jgi:hypothetical protein